jgi:stage II sporulation protein D
MKHHKRITGVGVIAIGLSILVSGLPGFAPKAAKPQAELTKFSRYIDADLIRVGISDNGMTTWEYPETQISATGPFTVRDQASGNTLLTCQEGQRLNITASAAGLTVNGNKPVQGPISIIPAGPDTRLKILNITRRGEIPEYRGTLEVLRGASSPNKLTVVNVVELEDYLKAVVPNELPMRYGLEAVKAQAIAARNYAIRPREKPWKVFDICDSQLCQVYFGAQSETPGSNQAIADTEGLVGLYDGEPILALFSSSHGGFAEAYSNAFSDPKTKQYPAPPIPYLVGGPDMPEQVDRDLSSEEAARKFWTDAKAPSFDVESPYYRWERRWNASELQNIITQGLAKVSADSSTRDFVCPLLMPGQTTGPIKDIRVLERGKSGKAMVLAIEAANGCWTVKKEFVIRKVFSVNGRMLPSGNVVFTPTRDTRGYISTLLVQGGGFGHGVGMSQLGASWMSKHGSRYPEIIQHYYKGVSLGSIPLEVGGTCPNQPTYTQFGVHRPYGILWIQDNGLSSAYSKEPVTVQLNDKLMTLTPESVRTAADVREYLKPGALNTLVLFPDLKKPERRLKAWIELYPPKSEDLAKVSQRGR